MQDAFAKALEVWPAQGLPAAPAAWPTTVARRRAVDLLRRRATGPVYTDAADMAATESAVGAHRPRRRSASRRSPATDVHLLPSGDRRTGADGARAATLGGLSTRRSRAPSSCREVDRWPSGCAGQAQDPRAGILPIPAGTRASARRPHAVLASSIRLQRGLRQHRGRAHLRAHRLREASSPPQWLGGLLPEEPEAQGPAGAALLHDARRTTRLDVLGDARAARGAGSVSRWQPGMIAEGLRVLAGAPATHRAVPAAGPIAALHAEAERADAADGVIVVLYAGLLGEAAWTCGRAERGCRRGDGARSGAWPGLDQRLIEAARSLAITSCRRRARPLARLGRRSQAAAS